MDVRPERDASNSVDLVTYLGPGRFAPTLVMIEGLGAIDLALVHFGIIPESAFAASGDMCVAVDPDRRRYDVLLSLSSAMPVALRERLRRALSRPFEVAAWRVLTGLHTTNSSQSEHSPQPLRLLVLAMKIRPDRFGAHPFNRQRVAHTVRARLEN